MKADNKVGTLQGLTRDKISDSLVSRVKYDKEGARRDLVRSIFKNLVATLQAEILAIKQL